MINQIILQHINVQTVKSFFQLCFCVLKLNDKAKSFSVDEIIEEAYERLGIQVSSGYQLKTARRSLNILFQEWGNRGIHYWEVA